VRSTTDEISLFRPTLEAISFSTKYKLISRTFIVDNYDDLLKQNDRKVIKDIFNELGYKAKYYSYGDYVITVNDEFGYEYKINFNLKRGMMVNYFGLSFKGQEIRLPENNFAFIYRYLQNDMNAEITAPAFKNTDDLKRLITEIMDLFNEIKNEFSIRISGKL
jgi:hypothetical protein